MHRRMHLTGHACVVAGGECTATSVATFSTSWHLHPAVISVAMHVCTRFIQLTRVRCMIGGVGRQPRAPDCAGSVSW